MTCLVWDAQHSSRGPTAADGDGCAWELQGRAKRALASRLTSRSLARRSAAMLPGGGSRPRVWLQAVQVVTSYSEDQERDYVQPSMLTPERLWPVPCLPEIPLCLRIDKCMYQRPYFEAWNRGG